MTQHRLNCLGSMRGRSLPDVPVTLALLNASKTNPRSIFEDAALKLLYPGLQSSTPPNGDVTNERRKKQRKPPGTFIVRLKAFSEIPSDPALARVRF
jgi:hypothetical protein